MAEQSNQLVTESNRWWQNIMSFIFNGRFEMKSLRKVELEDFDTFLLNRWWYSFWSRRQGYIISTPWARCISSTFTLLWPPPPWEILPQLGTIVMGRKWTLVSHGKNQHVDHLTRVTLILKLQSGIPHHRTMSLTHVRYTMSGDDDVSSESIQSGK